MANSAEPASKPSLGVQFGVPKRGLAGVIQGYIRFRGSGFGVLGFGVLGLGVLGFGGFRVRGFRVGASRFWAYFFLAGPHPEDRTPFTGGAGKQVPVAKSPQALGLPASCFRHRV